MEINIQPFPTLELHQAFEKNKFLYFKMIQSEQIKNLESPPNLHVLAEQ